MNVKLQILNLYQVPSLTSINNHKVEKENLMSYITPIVTLTELKEP